MNNLNNLEIPVYKSKKQGIKQPIACQNDILPRLHCSYLIIGKSGSGKTNVLLHLLNSPLLLKNAFDIILYLSDSPDDTVYDNLKIPKENFLKNWNEDNIEKILEKQEMSIKNKGFMKTPNILIVFDDVLSRPKFLNSKIVLKLVTSCRHFNISCIFNTQSYKKLPRTIRLQARGLILFPSSLNELNKFSEEQCLAQMSNKEFLKKIQYITSKPYQFAFINNDSTNERKLRKNFDTIIN
jgi:hypothetical protein